MFFLFQELHDLIAAWEANQGREFLVGGTNFTAFIQAQKDQHRQDLEDEKLARDKAKKETLLHETRFGAKPSTPAKLRGECYLILFFLFHLFLPRSAHNNTKTPRKMPPTPKNLIRSNSSRLAQKVVSQDLFVFFYLLPRLVFSPVRWRP